MNFSTQQPRFGIQSQPCFGTQPQSPLLCVNKPGRTKSEVMQMLKVTNEDYFDAFIKRNNIKEENGKYVFDEKNTIHPGLKICYIVLNKTSHNSVDTMATLINKYSDYETVIDCIPTSETDELPGLCKILQKIQTNMLYDFTFHTINGKLPKCISCIIDSIIDSKKMRSI